MAPSTLRTRCDSGLHGADSAPRAVLTRVLSDGSGVLHSARCEPSDHKPPTAAKCQPADIGPGRLVAVSRPSADLRGRGPNGGIRLIADLRLSDLYARYWTSTARGCGSADGDEMHRRDTVLALFALGAASPASFAQRQDRVWRVGFMAQINRPDPFEGHIFSALPRGLHELGYVEGKNLVIEWRFGDNKLERLPSLAAELAQARVDVIVTAGSLSAIAAQKATTTIPIVFGNVSDPVGAGLVRSLARPEGNVTGATSISAEIIAKVMQMLLSLVPRTFRVAVLIDPLQPSHLATAKDLQAAALRVRVRVQTVEARAPQDIEQAFAAMTREGAEALIVPIGGLFIQQRRQIADLAARHKLPSGSTDGEYAKQGGLFSYGTNQHAIFRNAAKYVDKILKGAKPADLPVEQPTAFELIINRKTAKMLGVTIPQSFLISAHEVVE